MQVRFVISGLFFSALILQACSVFRQNNDQNIPFNPEKDPGSIERECYNNNISGEDLIIGRTRIEYRSKDMTRSINGFIKQNREGNILISFRSLAGIEVARLFLNNDSIKIYDRINRTLYVQSMDFLQKKYGLSRSDMCFIWGDFPEYFLDKVRKSEVNGNVELLASRDGTSYILRPDIAHGKLKSVTTRQPDGNTTDIVFSEYLRVNGLLYPGRAVMNISTNEILIKVSFSGVKREKIKNMKFVVPNDANRIVLR